MPAPSAAEILDLSIDERLALVETIWESIRDNAAGLPAGKETIAEMQRRLDLHQAEPDAAADLDIVLARLRSKY